MHLDGSHPSGVLRVFMGRRLEMEHAEATWKGVADVAGSEPSFEDFFELEQERLLRVLWMVTGSLQEAEDIVQDTFIRVWERWPRVSAMESPTGYLHHAAMNIFRNRYRRARLELRKAFSTAPPDDAFASAEDRISVTSALRRLTSKQRAALVLTDLLGYPADEAGRMLGVRGSTVRSLSSTARAALRDAKELAHG
jgi:RNA polymerase sigma-70 factor (ECF subfamily)